MKRSSLLVLFVITGALLVHGQQKKVLNYQIVDEKRLHFGFTIGLNSMDFTFDRNQQYSDSLLLDVKMPGPGFNVNIVSELRFSDELALRLLPGLVFGQRAVQIGSARTSFDYGQLQIESNYIDIPVLLKYSGQRVNNFRPYLIGGSSVRFDMAAKKKNQLKMRDEDGIVIGDLNMNLKPFDYYAEIGVGFDFYLKFFKLSTELKLSYGLRQVLDTQLASAGLNNLSSNVVLLNFHFE
ncbi:MAG: porin family protein [Bacteroidales bacterium]